MKRIEQQYPIKIGKFIKIEHFKNGKPYISRVASKMLGSTASFAIICWEVWSVGAGMVCNANYVIWIQLFFVAAQCWIFGVCSGGTARTSLSRT